jgi:hypothetical protein
LPWFRADSNFPTHDKIIELCGLGQKGKAAAFVYFASLGWAVGHGTDGLIKRGALPFIHATTSDARLLVEAMLWDVVEGGWMIHNFGVRQAVGAIQQGISDSLSAVRSEAGRKGAEARWGAKD